MCHLLYFQKNINDKISYKEIYHKLKMKKM